MGACSVPSEISMSKIFSNRLSEENKNTETNATVINTTIVELKTSSRLGQITLRNSARHSLKN